MSAQRIEIFKKASNSLKKSLKCHTFLKKSLAFKKKPRGNCRIAEMASPPLFRGKQRLHDLNILNYHALHAALTKELQIPHFEPEFYSVIPNKTVHAASHAFLKRLKLIVKVICIQSNLG
jgi:hypothetical protein